VLGQTNSDRRSLWSRASSTDRLKAHLWRTSSSESDKSQRRSARKRKDSDEEDLLQKQIHEGLGFTVLCIKTLTDICVLWSKFDRETFAQSNMYAAPFVSLPHLTQLVRFPSLRNEPTLKPSTPEVPAPRSILPVEEQSQIVDSLNHLKTPDYECRYHRYRRAAETRLKTGQTWFTETKEYTAWREKHGPQVLWLRGRSGIGKSTIVWVRTEAFA
jgi:hypothetical protein